MIKRKLVIQKNSAALLEALLNPEFSCHKAILIYSF